MKNGLRTLGLLLCVIASGLVHASTEWSAQDYDLYAGDFNGDGKSDILYIAKSPGMPSGIAISDSSGAPNTSWQIWPSDYLAINWSGNAYNVIVADFNGDHKADILLQSKTPGGDSYLLLTSSAGFVVSKLDIANTALGFSWSADQHHIVAGDFNGDGKADLFFQATSPTGTNYVVLADTNGTFTVGPTQSWTDGTGPGPAGFKWSTQSANIFVGKFNGDGYADLLIQAKPTFVMIDYDVPFPVPTYPPNRNGVVLSQGGATPFAAANAQTWSRMSNGVDWSPLANNIIVANPGSGNSEVILQGKNAGSASYELTGNSTGPIFPSTATTLSSNVSLTADSYRLIAGNYFGGTGVGLYYQALTPSGTNYLTDAVGATTTAFVQNPTTVTKTVEATSVGRTGGQFVVSASGAAQYSIPIWAPPGPRGVQPGISLSYNSQASIGPLGIGWGLGGLGQITRCNLTVAQDQTPAPVALAVADGYCINGNRLRLTGGTYGTAGSTYQTEAADFSNITANGVAGNGPAYFTVQARDGKTYQYGYSDAVGGANSQVLANGSTTALSWMLSKVVDRSGNSMVINYLPQTGPAPSPPALALSGTTVPSTILWTPVSAGATTYAYKMQFNYGANVPASTIFQYVAGTAVTNAELLSSIEILSGSTVVKDYFLGYQSSPVTGRQELISLQECADAGQSNCLFPTSMGYQDGLPGVSTTPSTALSSAGSGFSARYDLNGDGYPDLVYANASTGTMYVAFGSPTGYGTPFNSFVPMNNAMIGKMTGAPQDGFVANKSGTFWYYSWNGSSFVGNSTGILFDPNSAGYQLADINGDGLADLVELSLVLDSFTHKDILTIYTELNTTAPTATAASFSNQISTAYSNLVVSAQLLTPNMQYGKLRRYDFNGDGRDDLVLKMIGEIGGTSSNVDTYELVATTTGFTATRIASVPGSSYAPVFITDWNDDKCTDFVSVNVLYIAACNGSAAQTYSLPGTILLGFDWDGDGRTDILVANGSTLGVYLSKGTGTPTLTPTSFPYSASCTYTWIDANADGLDDLGCLSASALTYYLHNGNADLATSFTDGYGNSASLAYVPISESNYTEYPSGDLPATYPDQSYIGPMYVVSTATFSDPSAAPGITYNQTFQYFGAWMNVQGRGFDGFGEIDVLDGRNGLTDKRYYQRAFLFAGMPIQETISNGSSNIRQATGTPTVIPLSSVVNQQRYFPYLNNWTVSEWDIGYPTSGNPVTVTTTAYTYDNYGNATRVTKTVTDNDPGSPYSGYSWTTDATNTTDISVNQTVDLAAWCLNLLDQTQVVYSSTLPGSTSVTRTKGFTPDTPAACRIKAVITEPSGGPYKVTNALAFDSFGNIQTETATGANMPASPATRVSTFNWGTTGQFLNSVIVPTGTVSNPTTATTSWSYTSSQSLTYGVPDSFTDANNLTTSWNYDAFGRKNKEIRSDSTSTTWTWNTCASFCGWSNSFYQIAQTAYQTNGSTVIRTDTTMLDPVDRATQTSGPNVTGSIINVQKLYNSQGLLVQQSMPFVSGAPAYQQTFAYDALNRIIESERPIKSTSGPTSCNPTTVPPISGCQGTNYVYAGRKLTMTDTYGNTKTIIKDVNGWLRQTQDAYGYNITRLFDAAGSLAKITDNVGNTLLSGACAGGACYAYGTKPFLVSASDADRGAWSYTVDSMGERIGWTDAKSQSFTVTYDALSRPVTRTDPITATDPGLFTQWQYGSAPANHNVGQLIQECSVTGNPSSCGASPQYSETRTFDTLGRLVTRSITEAGNTGNDAGGAFLYTFGYSSSTGFQNSLTYPISTGGVALNVQYGYQNGLLQSVTDTTDTTGTCGSSCVLWTVNAMNAFGEITQETLGNGVVSNRSYDAVTSWLSTLTAGVGGGTALLNQTYSQDRNGNVFQRQTNNLPAFTENFFYDADQRLTCATLSSTCSTPTFVYDGGLAGPGNITSQTGIGAYTYPAAGQPRPHAVTSIAGSFNGITNPSFTYDANGNMTNRAGSIVAWSSYNYPTDISANDVTGTEDVQLSYGPDRQRWKQLYTAPGVTENTYYIGGLMDRVFSGGTIDYRHYIFAGKKPVAVYSRTSGSVNTMSYMIEDHQGSVSTIASNAGTATVNESFSAFGARRNPATWSGAPITGDLNKIASLSRQGYTFQTWLGQSMGLNHMNGRVEDAILGRFLSPDPHIADPTNAQSYNRYSYVNNNPLSMIDPSGFCGYAVGYTPGTQVNTVGADGITEAIVNIGHSYIYFDASDCFSSPNSPPFTPPGLGAPFVAPPLPPFDPASVPAPAPVQTQPCSEARAAVGSIGSQLSALGKQVTNYGVGTVLVAGLGAFVFPAALPAEGAVAEVGVGLIELGGGLSTLGAGLQGYANAGVTGAITYTALGLSIDRLGSQAVSKYFPGINNSISSAVASLLSGLTDAVKNEESACGPD